MERRQFIKIVCGFVGAWPLGAKAQQPGNQRLIGILGADATAWGPWTVALTARLRELGWNAGDNLAIEYRWAQGRSDRVSEFAAEFERRKVDVIISYGGAVTTLKQTITSIPIASLPLHSIRFAAVWFRAWRIRLATLPESRSSSLILSASRSWGMAWRKSSSRLPT